MSKRYFKYIPIILMEEAYKEKLINIRNTYREHDFKYQRKNDFGIICLYEYYLNQNLTKHNLYGRINYYCYEKDLNYYDLLTDELLTPIDRSNETNLEANRIYIDEKEIEEQQVSDVLAILKLFPKRELKNYKEYLLNEIKTTTPEKYNLQTIYNKYYSSKAENKKNNELQKKLENRVSKLKK